MESQHKVKDKDLEIFKDQQIIEWRNKVRSTIVKWRWERSESIPGCPNKHPRLAAKQKEKPKDAKQGENCKTTACSRAPESHNKKGKKQKRSTNNKKDDKKKNKKGKKKSKKRNEDDSDETSSDESSEDSDEYSDSSADTMESIAIGGEVCKNCSRGKVDQLFVESKADDFGFQEYVPQRKP
ncbi:hypothetical protein CDAR_481181 [Caerostris darwini]|uniref:Uncharacterized protein n=1 Tax=Caerostris darwini TaxID=1538125 RepID=A0AAV4N8R1_9ARAC|nr:hypothetical protein CDAR_481181 [Caerostris darwini]